MTDRRPYVTEPHWIALPGMGARGEERGGGGGGVVERLQTSGIPLYPGASWIMHLGRRLPLAYIAHSVLL